jgi:PAS domain S-box-containing protein
MSKITLNSLPTDTIIQLAATQERLEFALESGRMGTWDIDLENDTVASSDEMLRIWGVSREEFDGQRSILQTKVHPDDLEKMQKAIDKAIATDTIYELEYRIIPRPGRITWVMSRGKCVVDPITKRLLRFSGVVFDITEKKVKQQELDEAVKARALFFTIAGHELKTPLTSLLLHQKLMELDVKNQCSPEQIGSSLKKQREQIEKITRIVEHILDESRIKEGLLPMKNINFNLNEAVANVTDQFKIIAEADGVQLNFQGSDSIPFLGDKFRIEQVVLNLLTNALRYGDKKPILVSVKNERDRALISVRDQGRGIKLEDQRRIFKEFERITLGNEAHGIGLGLYISNSIVLSHGGEILLKSEIDKGSEFTISLPLNR